ncbi:MAG: Qat anti-phage system ATPase QatA [Amphiplicatus sp.]
MIIPDNETEIDLLYYEAISKTVIDLLNSAGETPLTIGVHGDWGAGKSSILKMLAAEFEDSDDTLCIVFNGWLFQGFEDTKAVLIETIIEELGRNRTLTAAAKKKAGDLLKRVNWMKVAKKMGGLAFTAATGIPTAVQLKSLISAAKGLLGGEGDFAAEDVEAFITEGESYLNEAEPETVPDHIHAFREEFSDLLREAKIERLIVVVDDLDRCLPETSIETLEAIRLFLFVPGAAFVIAADEAMIEYAVKKHFPDLPLTQGPASYAQNYLEKLIQVPFRLPPLGYVETRTYITLLMTELELGSDDDAFLRLVELTKDVLRRPWDGGGFERDAIAAALGAVPPAVENAIQLADQIAPILTDGARGNPRQVKRFLNTMALRLAIAERRGIADDIAIPVLSKLMLAERFDTDLYDRIARETNVDGTSDTLKTLEAAVDKDDDAVVGKASEEDNPLSEWSRRWLALEPRLADIDLRPYLFISRDRKAPLFGGGGLPQLEAFIEKLCGGRLEAKAVAAEVGKLPPGEAERYFNALLSRVRGASDLKTRPPGVYGLMELCKVHPTFQNAVVSMLNDFTIARLGVWAAAGWADVFSTEESKKGYRSLREKWAAQEENNGLKVAAATSLKKGAK